MGRMSAPMALAVAVACGLTPLVPATWAAASGGSWGQARAVPGLAALNKLGRAQIFSVSCATAGNCSAGGSYLSGAGQSQPFIVNERNGAWGRARQVAGAPRSAPPGEASAVYSVSCPAPGDCTAGGGHFATPSSFVAFVVRERNGVWGKAHTLPGAGDLAAADTQITSVSCAAAGDCAAGGTLTYHHGLSHPFVIAERHGAWGPIDVLSGAALLAATNSVSCPAIGECEAGGFYADTDFLITEHRGRWETPIQVPGMNTLNTSGGTELTSLSCAEPGSCAAGGWYSNDAGNFPFIVTQRNGTWGKATPIPGMHALNTGLNASLNTLSCAALGACAAGGYYYDRSGGGHAFVVTERAGTWGKAIEVPGMRALNPDTAQVFAISCAASGYCAAGGVYYQGRAHAFVVTQRHGAWGKAVTVPGLRALNTGGRAEVVAISCAAAVSCVAGGTYTDRAGQQVFVVSGP